MYQICVRMRRHLGIVINIQSLIRFGARTCRIMHYPIHYQKISNVYNIQHRFFTLTNIKTEAETSSNTNTESKGKSREEVIKKILIEQFKPRVLNVQDVSGGCGAMYNILLVSDQFNGQTPVKRHKAVLYALRAQVEKMHGISLLLKTEEEYKKLLEKQKK